MKVAVIQFCAGDDKSDNIRRAAEFVREAISKKAKFILLPEGFVFRGDLKKRMAQIAEKIPGESIKPLMVLAKRHKIFILAGSFCEKTGNPKKSYNTSVLIDSRGRIAGTYRKMNLFDAVLGRKTIKESDRFLRGQKAVVAKVNDFKVGMSICYDLRFPELYQTYFQRGAQILCVPSVFTYETGKAHWETLLRARAIENFCYVLAPNQIGKDHRGVKSYGHSMIVGPWGEILTKASGNTEKILYAELRMKDVRQRRRVFGRTV